MISSNSVWAVGPCKKKSRKKGVFETIEVELVAKKTNVNMICKCVCVFMLKTERRILRTGITDRRPSKKVWIGSNFPGGVS